MFNKLQLNRRYYESKDGDFYVLKQCSFPLYTQMFSPNNLFFPFLYVNIMGLWCKCYGLHEFSSEVFGID